MEPLSILLLLTGSFWYALFNMSKGAMLLPGVLTEMAQVFNIKVGFTTRTYSFQLSCHL